jgi:hypothetical protein
MRRKIAIALLAAGTFLGYGSAVAHAVRAHRVHDHCAGWHSSERGEPDEADGTR